MSQTGFKNHSKSKVQLDCYVGFYTIHYLILTNNQNILGGKESFQSALFELE
jgi:hypothetical protein